LVPRQANNAYIFPGVGLGVIACGARRVTDDMFFTAARALASVVTDSDLAQGSLFPPLGQLRDISASIAVAVCRVAYEKNLATVPNPDDLRAFLEAQMYDPTYDSMFKSVKGTSHSTSRG
jgi:malate dehydrogenase (oxaloacetate-decarboxylating)(NADP+)